MSRPLVCGIDGSDQSLAAAAAAAQISRDLGSTLVLGYVVEDPAPFPRGHEHEQERYWSQAEQRAEHLFESIERRHRGARIEGRLLRGRPAEALRELAGREEAAMLVVGSRGRGAVRAALLGSVSADVVRHSDRPVLVAAPGAEDPIGAGGEERSTVACGVDGSEEAAGAARAAAQLATVLGLDLVLVHAYPPRPSSASMPAPGLTPPIARDLDERQREGARGLLEATARDIGAEASARFRVELGEDAAAVLDRCAEEEGARMIVVGTHGRGRLASAVLGSTSARLAASASRPVVVVPAGASLADLSGEPASPTRASVPGPSR